MKNNRIKKRYNKLVAYLLMDFSTVGVCYGLMGLAGLIMGIVKEGKELIIGNGGMLIISFVCLFLTFLLTLYINSRTPKGERVGTWFRAYWLGWKIAWKMALCCTLFLIPLMLKWSIKIPESDSIEEPEPNWYDERGKVYDDNGNEFKVGRSGEYVQDKKGNWHKVNRDNSNEPYLGDSDRTYLK